MTAAEPHFMSLEETFKAAVIQNLSELDDLWLERDEGGNISLTPVSCDRVQDYAAKEKLLGAMNRCMQLLRLRSPTPPAPVSPAMAELLAAAKAKSTSSLANKVCFTTSLLATLYVVALDFDSPRLVLLFCDPSAGLKNALVVLPQVNPASVSLAIVLAFGVSPWGVYQIVAVRYALLIATAILILARLLFHVPVPFCSAIALGAFIPQLMLNAYCRGARVMLDDFVKRSAASAVKRLGPLLRRGLVQPSLLMVVIVVGVIIVVIRPSLDLAVYISRECAVDLLNPRYFSVLSDIMVFGFVQAAIVVFVMMYTITYAGGLDRTLRDAHISFVFRTDKYGIVIVYAGFSLLAELHALHRQFDLNKLASTHCFASVSGAGVASSFQEHFALRLTATILKVMGIAFVFSLNTTRDIIEHSQAHFIGLGVVAIVTVVEKLYEIGFAATKCYLHPSTFAPIRYDEVLYAHAGTTVIQLLCLFGYLRFSRAAEKLRTTRVKRKSPGNLADAPNRGAPSPREFCLNITSVFYETLLLAVTISGVPQMLLASADSLVVAVVPPCVFLFLHMLTIGIYTASTIHDTSQINVSALGSDHKAAATLVKRDGTVNLRAMVALYDRVIEKVEMAASDVNHNFVAVTLHGKANALVAMGGSANLAKAVTLYDRVIEITMAAFGANHIETAATIQAKATALVFMGGSANLQAAIALYDRVIEIKTTTFGANHIETAVTMQAKAAALVKRGGSGKLQAAVALCDRVIEIKTTTFGANHIETVASMGVKATALVKMGGSANFHAAMALYDRVIQIQTAAFGANHTETAASMRAKAMAMVKMGGSANFQAAIALYDRVIEIQTAAFGANHTETAASMRAKATTLVKMGGSANFQAAMALYNRVIEIKTNELGANHIETAATMHAKAMAMVKMGGSANFQAAIALYDRVIEITTTAFGANHTETAAPMDDRAIEIDVRGGGDSETAATMRAKAFALVLMGGSANFQAALDLYDRVIEIHAAAEGDDHTERARTMQQKAHALFVRGGSANLKAAVALYDSIIAMDMTALGADHTFMAVTMLAKANVLVDVGVRKTFKQRWHSTIASSR
jgi:hypothetical protein